MEPRHHGSGRTDEHELCKDIPLLVRAALRERFLEPNAASPRVFDELAIALIATKERHVLVRENILFGAIDQKRLGGLAKPSHVIGVATL